MTSSPVFSTASRAHHSGTRELSSVFPLLVAIAGDAASTAAIQVAHALARECGAVPTVLRVVQHDIAAGATATGAMGGVPETALDPAYRTTELTVLQGQVKHVLGELPPWHFDVEVGATVPTVVSRTHALHAELLILGLPQHNFFRRAFVRDTVQGVIEATNTAVLALRPEIVRRPESILVAVDFSLSSLRAAHLACDLIAPGGRVILVYVQPDVPANSALDVTPPRADGAISLHSAFMSLIEELTSRKMVTITSVIEHGNSIQGIKAVAERMQPEVIAFGAHHHSAVDWFFGDSVSTNLVSERHWSLLVVPA